METGAQGVEGHPQSSWCCCSLITLSSAFPSAPAGEGAEIPKSYHSKKATPPIHEFWYLMPSSAQSRQDVTLYQGTEAPPGFGGHVFGTPILLIPPAKFV